MTRNEYRQKHRKCKFCKHLRYVLAPLPYTNYMECKIKDKIINFPNFTRKFCKCFELKEMEEQNGIRYKG